VSHVTAFRDLVTADLTGDGNVDLISVDMEGLVSLWQGDGLGGFSLAGRHAPGGDLEATRGNARANIESLNALVQEGYDVVVPGPTCSYMLKREYPLLLKEDAAEKVAARTFDICEYLMGLHSAGRLDTRFVKGAGRVAYQIPCHLRAQNIGYKSRDLLQLIPGTTVHLIEKCSAIDGTWGLKQQYYDLSLQVAEALLRDIRESQADITASDCPLAALQIRQGSGQKPLHPIQLLERAYGLERQE